MNRDRFVTAINCIDGRAQIPVLDWMRLHCNVRYVDLITEPGADMLLNRGSAQAVETIRKKVIFSLQAHQSSVVAIAGHHDCLANPVTREEHWEDIKQSVQIIRSWQPWVRTVGLWVNEWGSVDLVCDTK
jgi:hypothetical protein